MSTAIVAALIGLAVGSTRGFAVRPARLRIFGALEDALIGGDFRRLKMFALTLSIALMGTQGLIGTGLLALEDTTYLPLRLASFGISTDTMLMEGTQSGLLAQAMRKPGTIAGRMIHHAA